MNVQSVFFPESKFCGSFQTNENHIEFESAHVFAPVDITFRRCRETCFSILRPFQFEIRWEAQVLPSVQVCHQLSVWPCQEKASKHNNDCNPFLSLCEV